MVSGRFKFKEDPSESPGACRKLDSIVNSDLLRIPKATTRTPSQKRYITQRLLYENILIVHAHRPVNRLESENVFPTWLQLV